MDPASEQAFRNIWRMLETHRLTDHIISTNLQTADRFFFEADGTMSAVLTQGVMDGRFREVRPSGGPHNMVYSLFAGTWGKMRSWRSLSKPSLQVTLTEVRVSQRRWVGDADIDLGNPVMDVVGFMTHAAEVILPGKTSHRKLEKTVTRIHENWVARHKKENT
jgi:hypothetical protein